MKIHLSLNENTFTFCPTTKFRFLGGPGRRVYARKTRAVVGIRITATQATPVPCDSGVQRRPKLGPWFFQMIWEITPQLFSCALLCIVTFVAFEGVKICSSFGSISFAGWVVIELERETEREWINRERGLLVFVWGEEYKSWDISVST